MECPESFYYLSFDNLSIPSFSAMHEKSLENTIFTSSESTTSSSSTMTAYNYEHISSVQSSPISSNTSIQSNSSYQQGMLSPTYFNSFYGTSPSSSSSNLISQSMVPFTPLPPSELGFMNHHHHQYNNNQHHQNQCSNYSSYQSSCFPSPVNSIIEFEPIPSPSTTNPPHTVKSHSINQINYNQNEVILTSINDKKKKTLSKKQKKINELPYAPNLLNLQLVSINNNNNNNNNGQQNASSSSSSFNRSHNNNNNNNNNNKKQKQKNVVTASSSSINTTTTTTTTTQQKKQTKSPSAYKCDYPNCEKTFTRPYNLKSHRRTHTAERPFVCPLCPKSFARQHDRNRHAKLHLGIKPYICHFCDKPFARQDALNRHQRVDDLAGPSCARTSCRKKKKHQRLSSTSV